MRLNLLQFVPRRIDINATVNVNIVVRDKKQSSAHNHQRTIINSIMNWAQAIAECTISKARANCGFVLVTVLGVKGSAPRNACAKMVVTESRSYDTIGGGNLEYQAIAQARELLTADAPAIVQREFSLGAELSQCCGGAVTLLLECFPACRFNIALFGAGHVGQALAKVLAELPCRLWWFDSRDDVFPSASANTQTITMQNPFAAVDQCPPAAFYLIMTHSHELDIEICEAVLTRGDSKYCGLIGSKSKAAKFRSRLRKKGFSADELAQLTCPIGLPQLTGKTPMEVAVSVAGQLLALRGDGSVDGVDGDVVEGVDASVDASGDERIETKVG